MHDRSRRQKNHKKHRSLVPVAVRPVVREGVAVAVAVLVVAAVAVTVVVAVATVAVVAVVVAVATVAVVVLENVVVTLLKAVTVVVLVSVLKGTVVVLVNVLKGTVVVLDRRRRVVAAESSHLLAEGLDRLEAELHEHVAAVDVAVVAAVGAHVVVVEHARDELTLGIAEQLDAKLHRRAVLLREHATRHLANTQGQVLDVPGTKVRVIQVLDQKAHVQDRVVHRRAQGKLLLVFLRGNANKALKNVRHGLQG